MQQSIESYSFKNKRAIVRVDLNVPLDSTFKITDDTRIRAIVPTVKKILSDGGSAILISHMGRPMGVEDKYSLKHIVYRVEELLGMKISFAPDCQNASTDVAALKPGEVLLLENLRFYSEEEGKPRLSADVSPEEKERTKIAMKEAQAKFTKTLASYANCYINDAFGTAHRAHASTSLIADYFPNDKMFGYVMENELTAIDALVKNAKSPYTAIIGGSKVSTKITIIESLMDKVDHLILCGGMTYTFAAALGGRVGGSLCEKDQFDTALNILRIADKKNVVIYLAEDSLCGDSFSDNSNKKVYPTDDITDGWQGLDIGPVSREKFAEVIRNSKTILWNGPAGVFEMDSFAEGSRVIAEAIVEATANGAYSLIGGGDTIACINKFGVADKVSYTSTGGGALLEYMEGKELPGIIAIRN